MGDQKCMTCGSVNSKKWIEKANPMGEKAYFCSKKCYDGYKSKSDESGVCEFC